MASMTTEALAGSSSPPLPCSSTNHYTYQVFLSFRGDTRFNFTDHLYTALDQRGIHTFRDAEKLRKGDEISLALVKAIEESRASVIIFSEKYASSRWCLDELVHIMECRESKGQKVRAVFYKVDPSHVRYQQDAFGAGFAKLEGRYENSMSKWSEALGKAAELSGWTYKEDRSEAEFIKMIVDELCAQVVNPSCDIDLPNLTGLQYQDVIHKLLHAKEGIVYMLGIWGPGGIGKTTIASAVFNSIRHRFQGSCFIQIPFESVNSESLAKLQKTFLSSILKDPTLGVSSVGQGISLMKERLPHIKVLLILDNVSDSSQLKSLVPDPKYFKAGSRILITTRDKRWLKSTDGVYEVRMLDDHQALELFSLNAFKRNQPPGEYIELACHAVSYAQGLPLALTVLGSHLSYCSSRDEWETILDRCKRGAPPIGISNILKLSYDALEGDLQGYFLDIACFFKGRSVEYVKPILDACYNLTSATAGIAQLEQKALIRIERGVIWMHDLIEDMGKDIVHQESPDEPGRRSRLWSTEDINHVLSNNTGTNKVIGIQLVPMSIRERLCLLNAKSISKMKKLKYISMGHAVQYELISGGIGYLSKELRWFKWINCPMQSFPSDFHASKLVKLEISSGEPFPGSPRIARLWDAHKNFQSLTSMRLWGCNSLTELPDFGRIPNLKELNVSYCESLVEVPDSVGLLDKLVTLTVDKCYNLIKFSRQIKLKSLETLSIWDCKLLEEFSEVGEEMCCLKSLNLSGTGIKELHSSIGKLTRLRKLELVECRNITTLPYNVFELSNLEVLDARWCSSLAISPKFPAQMSSLKKLLLDGIDIIELDESIGNLIGLEELGLSRCFNLGTLPCNIYALQKLRYFSLIDSKPVRFPMSTNTGSLSYPKLPCFGIPSKHVDVNISHSRDFTQLPDGHQEFSGLSMSLTGCKSLTELPDFSEIPDLKALGIFGCADLDEASNSVQNFLCYVWEYFPCPDDFREEKEISSFFCLDLSRSDIKELPPSITNFIRLESLNLEGCEELTTLPYNIHELHSLKSLDATYCTKLVTFPEIWIQMDCLRQLTLSRSGITELDESIGNLTGLQTLDLDYCKNLRTLPCSIYELQNLLYFHLKGCSTLVRFPTNLKADSNSLSLPKLQVLCLEGCTSLSDYDFLVTLDCWETLRKLDFSVNNFVSLPACLIKCVKLRPLTLFLWHCKKLRQLPKLLPYVYLYIDGSESLEIFPNLSNPGAVIEAEGESASCNCCGITHWRQHCPNHELSLPKRKRTQ